MFKRRNNRKWYGRRSGLRWRGRLGPQGAVLNVFGPKLHPRTRSEIGLQNISLDERKIQSLRRHEVGMSGLEVEEASDLLGAYQVHGLSQGHLITDIPEKSVVTGDNDFGCPVTGCDAEELELDGKDGRISPCVIDIAVNTPDKGCDDLLPIRMVVAHLLFHVHTSLEKPRADVLF
jgi:hypothetical protein